MRPHLLFDLDGTLTDPKVGIITCIQHALREFGHNPPATEALLWCIGPPLYHSFPILVPEATREDVEKLVALYRSRFGTVGLFENEVYQGIPELLAGLAQKRALYLATSKPLFFARKIMDHFRLSPHFEALHGSELDGTRSEKGDLISYILKTEGIRPEDALLVGDTTFDVAGAKKNGLLSVGITWGYGSREQLAAAGADHIFDRPEELREFLLR